ncbi:MAG: EVE domain-containing protein [Acidobacteria bacterium]|nr:EVE domain-containing protein [Acidobacteriota bacterium]
MKARGRWLLKTDPDEYRFEDLLREAGTVWDGVANNLALQNLRSIHRGDLAFIYHTGEERTVVGVAEVISDPYPDPRQDDSKLVVIDIKSKHPLSRGVTLAELKAHRGLKDFDLIRLPRLSVVPVTDEQWEIILGISKT